MNCPNCNNKLRVLDSAANDKNVYRIRVCDSCKTKIGTCEEEKDYDMVMRYINYIKFVKSNKGKE